MAVKNCFAILSILRIGIIFLLPYLPLKKYKITITSITTRLAGILSLKFLCHYLRLSATLEIKKPPRGGYILINSLSRITIRCLQALQVTPCFLFCTATSVPQYGQGRRSIFIPINGPTIAAIKNPNPINNNKGPTNGITDPSIINITAKTILVADVPSLSNMEITSPLFRIIIP